MNQMVLVAKRETLERVGMFQGYALDVERYASVLLDSGNNFFMDRDLAECDDTYKQLIPYVVLRHEDSVFSYVRGTKSSESRLVARRSIGVGGHIEPGDQSLFSSDREMYLDAARREVNEEVKLDTMYREHVAALINDDSTEVGRVHLGIMHIWDVAEPNITKREALITQAGFVGITELKKSNELETWSQIALKVLEQSSVPSWSDVMAGRRVQQMKSHL